MKDYNIEDLWANDVAPESSFKLDVLPGGIKSTFGVFSELKRIRNLFWWQWLMEIGGILLACFQFMRHGESITIGGIGLAVLGSGITYYFYISYFRKFLAGINDSQSKSMKEALHTFLDSLNEYIKNVMRLLIIILIIDATIYVLVSVIGFESVGRLIADLVAAVFGYGLTYAALTGWFDFMYKDSITELENAIRNLE